MILHWMLFPIYIKRGYKKRPYINNKTITFKEEYYGKRKRKT